MRQGIGIWYKMKKVILITLLFVLADACQIPYEAEVEEKTGVISIDGSIVKGDSVQQIVISRSTSLYDPKFDPLKACVVSVEDDLNQVFVFTETDDGIYTSAINQEFLVVGRNYRLQIITSLGEQYESEYVTINPVPEVDSIYSETKIRYSASQKKDLPGVQFYIDLEALETDSRYYRWGLVETWEYESAWEISYMLLDDELTVGAPESPIEFYRCWATEKVPGLYAATTVNLSLNQKKRVPLHFVSSESSRLGLKYSLLVKQYSLNEGAYNYWNQNKTEIEESGGLYTRQPGKPLTNLYNVNDPGDEVLGYFWTSSKAEKRIFVLPPENFKADEPHCSLDTLDLTVHGRGPFPVYVTVDGGGTRFTGNPHCFNCTLRGGENKKPDFWEDSMFQ